MSSTRRQNGTDQDRRVRSAPLLASAFIVAVVLVVYGRCVTFEFLSWDDDIHVTQNPNLTDLSWSSVGQFWIAPYEGLYIPLSYTFLAAETLVSRLLDGSAEHGSFHPGAYHAGSLALHCACALLVYAWLSRLLSSRWSALVGTLVFAVHPLQTESVAWISETRGLLSAFCSLIALLLLTPAVPLRSAADAGGNAERNEQSASSRRTLLRLVLATAAFVLALLAKPTAAALPLMLFVMEAGFGRRSLQKALVVSLPWLAVAVLFAIVTRHVQDVDVESIGVSVWARPIIAADSISFYLTKLVGPWPLAIDYGRTPEAVLSSTLGRISWMLPAVLVLCLARWNNRMVWSAFGIFVLGLTPVLGLVPFAFQQTSTVADRYVYLAMLGPAFLVGWSLERLPHRWAVALACCGIAILGTLSAKQTAVWRNDTTLYTHALDVNPSSAVAHNNLGVLRLRQGRLDEALRHFDKARTLDKRYTDAHYNYGLVLANQERFEESLPAFEASLKFDPNRAQTHYDLGVALGRLGRTTEARRHYVRTILLEKDHALAHNNLGVLLAADGQIDRAIPHYRTALAREPGFVDAHVNLAQAYLVQGRFQDAALHFEEALTHDANLPQVQFNLGLIAEIDGDLVSAEEHYVAAVALDPEFRKARFRFAEILLESERFDSAAAEFKQILVFDGDNVDGHNGLGRALRRLGDIPGAIVQFEAALVLDEFSTTAHREWTEIDEQRGTRDAARIRLRAAIDAVPPDSDVLRELQQILEQLKSD